VNNKADMSEQHKERRRSKRVTLEKPDRLPAAVETPGGTDIDGHLNDFSVDGVAISFSGKDIPPLFMGQTVTLTLRVPMPSQKYSVVSIDAQVRNFVYDPATEIARCGLEFENRIRRDSNLFSALYTIANQRNAVRIEPDRQSPVTIELKTPNGLQAEGTIRDISATGVSIVVSGDLEKSDIGMDTIELSFSLPDTEGDVDLSGTIRHKKLDMDATWVGIEFDEQEDTRTDTQQQKILRYIMQRQRELLKK